ncbi:transmembrane protein, putative [Bodo saltans]|uniref:Transmembrane protein, putative n=1 Tax=Bodo saltans TaxID=75058 RepID=A0A0S4KE56_BODSA|nr:transmembrane protein, putative [Bodo saltans]|eukprot:CUI11710.1 transmembrane protein, putative [Bodo saltans]
MGFFIVAPVWTNGFVVIGPSGKTTTTTTAGLAPQLLTVSNTSSFMNMGTFTQSSILIRNHVTVLITNGSIAFSAVDVISDLDVTMKCEASGGDACTYFPKVVVNGQISPLLRSFFVCTFGSAKQVTLSILDGSSLTLANRSTLLGAFLVLDGAKIIAEKGGGGANVVDASSSIHVLSASSLIGTGGSRAIVQHIVVSLTSTQELVINGSSFLIASAGGPDNQTATAAVSNISMSLTGIELLRLTTASSFISNDVALLATLTRPQLRLQNVFIGFVNCSDMLVSSSTLTNFRDTLDVAIVMTRSILYTVGAVLVTAVAGANNNSPATIDGANFSVCDSGSRIVMTASSFLIGSSVATITNSVLTFERGVKASLAGDSRLIDAGTGVLRNTSLSILSGCDWNCSAVFFLRGVVVNDVRITIGGNDTVVKLASVSTSMMVAVTRASNIRFDICDGATVTAVNTQMAFLYAPQATDIDWKLHGGASVLLSSAATGWMCLTNATNVSMSFRGSSAGGPPPPPGRSGGGQFYMSDSSVWMLVPIMKLITVTVESGFQNFVLNTSSSFVRNSGNIIDFAFYVLSGSRITIVRRSGVLLSTSSNGIFNNTDFLVDGIDTLVSLDGGFLASGSTSSTINYLLNVANFRIWVSGGCRVQLANSANIFYHPNTLQRVTVGVTDASTLSLSSSSIGFEDVVASVSKFNTTVVRGGQLLLEDESTVLQASSKPALVMTDVLLSVSGSGSVAWISYSSHFLDVFYGALIESVTIFVDWNGSVNVSEQSYGVFLLLVTSVRLVSVVLQTNATLAVGSSTPSSSPSYVIDFLGCRNVSRFTFSAVGDATEATSRVVFGTSGYVSAFDCYIAETTAVVRDAIISVANARLEMLSSTGGLSLVALFSDCQRESVPAVSNITVSYTNVVIVISGTAQLHPGIYSAGTILQNWQMRLANVSVERGDSQRANPSAPRYVVGGPTVIFFFQERGNSASNSNGVATMTNSTIFLNPTDLEMNALRNDIILMNGGGSGSFLTPPTSTELAALLDSNTFDSLQQRRGGIYVVLWFCRSGRFGNTTIALDNVAAIGGNRTAALLAINTAQLTNSDLVVRVTRAYMMLNCSATLLELRNITTTAGTATQQRVELTVDQSKVWMRGSDGSAPRSNSQLLYLEGTTVSPSAIVTIVMHSNVTVGPRASLCNATRVCGGASSTGTPSSSNVTVRIESSVVQLSPTDRVSLWSPPRSPATLYDTGRLDDYLPLQQTSLVQVDISGTCTAATQQQEPAAVPSCSLSNATTTTALMLTLSVQDTIVTVFPWMIPAEIARAMPLSTLLNLHQSSSIARIEASTSYNATCSSNTSKNAVIMHVGTRVELRNDSSLIMSMPSMVAASVDLFNDGRAETISSSAPVVSVIGSVGLTPSSSYVAVNGNVSSVVVSGNVTVEGFPAVLGSQLFSQPSIPLDVQWETCHTTRRSGSGGGSPHDYASSAMWRYGGIRRAFGAKSAVNLLLLDLSTNSSEFSSTNTTKNNNSTGNSSSLVLLLALSRLPEVRFDVLRTQQVGKGACVPDRILSPTFSMSDVGSSSSTASESQEMLPSPTVALMISVSKGITPSNRDPSGTTTQLLSDEFSHSFPSPSITISEEPKAQAFRAQAQAVKYREVVRATVAVGLSAVSGSLAGVGIAFTTRTGSSLLECGRDVNENVDWLLNPLQLRTGPSEGGGSLRGAVIGNIVLTSAMMVMMVAVAAGCARRRYRGGDDEDKQLGLEGHRQRSNRHQHVEHFYRILAKGFRFPGILLAPYSILIIPIGSNVAAALLLLNPNDIGVDDGDGTLVNVVLALLSMLLVVVGYFLIGIVVLFQFQAQFQLQPQMFDRDEYTKGTFTPSVALMLEMARAFVTKHTVLGAWANLPTTRTTTADSSTRSPKIISRVLFVERYGYLFDGFCNGRHWYVLLDCAFAAAVCLIDGLQPPALPSSVDLMVVSAGGAAVVEAQDTGGSSTTPNCTPHLIALSICNALQFFACLFLRPSMVPFDTAFALFTDAIGALAAAVGAANAAGATELFDMVMWIGVIQLALAICSVASASGSVSSSIRRWVAEFLVPPHDDEGVHQFDDLQRSWEELQQIQARERNFNEGGKKAHHVRKNVSMCQLLEEKEENAFENVIAMQRAPQDDVLHVDQLISPPLPSSRSFGKTYRLRRGDSHNNNNNKNKSSSCATPDFPFFPQHRTHICRLVPLKVLRAKQTTHSVHIRRLKEKYTVTLSL